MTRKHFTIFVEVCRFLNFSQAAEALNTTQPAVSLAVRRAGKPLWRGPF